MQALALSFLLLLAVTAWSQTDCSVHDLNQGPFPCYNQGTKAHSSDIGLLSLLRYQTVARSGGQGPATSNGGVVSSDWVQNCPKSSPLLVDTTGNGRSFPLTNPAKNCTLFDLKGDGQLACWSWPQHGSGVGFLTTDKGVMTGQDLFGNWTPHADADYVDKRSDPLGFERDPNGFLALQYFDQRAQGGDGNLIIDRRDSIWPHLRIWIDDHCWRQPNVRCTSLDSELHTLDDLGIHSLSLVYKGDVTFDEYGNEFKYSAPVNPEAEDTPRDARGNSCCDLHQKSKDGRLMYDVNLVPRN